MAALAQQAIRCPNLLCPNRLCPNLPPSWSTKDRDPKETPKKGAKKNKDNGHKEESPKGNNDPCQDMDPKQTPQDQELKHKDAGHKEESPKGNREPRQDKDPKDKEDGHKAK